MRYLKKALEPDEFQKVVFLDATSEDLLNSSGAGLFINIDSMAEMEVDVAKNYLALIDQKGSLFYSCNPIGKYHPSMIGIQEINELDLVDVYSLGLCREIIDVFDNTALAIARNKYLTEYRPSENWRVLKSEVSLPWKYYHHVLYKNDCSVN